jgi:hypothetical protein
MDTLSAILGWAALPVAILRFQLPGLRPLLICNGIGMLLLAAHMLLSGLYSGAVIALSAGGTALLQATLGRRLAMGWRVGIALPSIAVCVALTVSGLSGWRGLLPVASFVLGRLSETRDDDLQVRCINLVSMSIWVGYFAAMGSMPGLAFHLVGIVSNVIGIWRFHGRRSDSSA